MNIKKTFLRWTVVVLAVLMLAACGTSTTSSPASGNPPAQKAQTGQVTFSVQFPKATLAKALMDNRTIAIDVQWRPYEDYSTQPSSITLIPDAGGLATTTVEVPIGAMEFTATARDSNNAPLDVASNAGIITAGNNTVYLTFLGGDWQFVDANDNPLPQSFGTTTLAGFSLKSGQATSAAAKATVDPAKPRGWNDYQLQWQSGTDPATTFTPIGPVMISGQQAQFNVSTVSGSSFQSDWLNITDPTRSETYNGVEVDPVQGDRLVWILDWEDGDGPSTITDAVNNDLIPGFRSVGDSQVLDGNHIGGHLMAMTFESVNTVQLATNVDCRAFYAQQATPAAARAAAIKASLAKSAGKAAIGDNTILTAGTATVKYVECNENYSAPQVDADGDNNFFWEELTYDANGNWFYDAGDTFNDMDGDGRWDYTYYPGITTDWTEQYSNLVAREFRAKGSQAGSVFTPPTVSAMPYSSDVNTVLLDHLDGATNASILAYSETGAACGSAKPSATPNSVYVAGLNGLSQALSLNPPAGQPAGSATYLQYPGGELLSQSNGTIEFWTYLTTYGAGGVSLVSQGPFPGSCAGWTYSLGVDASGQLRSAAWAAFDVNSGITTVPLNAWTHVAASWGSTGAKLYINGELVGSDVNTGMPASGYSGTVLVGSSADGLRIDELRISDMQRTSFSPPAIQASAVGTWMGIEPGTNKVIIMAFPDSSNYLMGEDGIADGFGGMPGVEVGTYSFNPAATEATFNVTYETNGNWGPATVGVPGTMTISELTATTMTIWAADSSTPFSFDRVVPDPLNPIIGSWHFTTAGSDGTVLVLLNNGQYYAIQADETDTNNRFFESGFYSWDSGSGTFIGTGVFSSNPLNSAVAAPSETNTLTININGSTLTLSNVDGNFTATRL